MTARARVLWFTGHSGSGKTTIAERLARSLEKAGKRVRILDGDAVRSTMHAHLGFTPEDIIENNRLIAEMCLEEINDYDFILVPVISPFSRARKVAREIIGKTFRLIYLKVSVEEAMRRDPKGLYKKALAGEIENFIGVSENVPYEVPDDADLVLDAEGRDEDQCLDDMMGYIRNTVRS